MVRLHDCQMALADRNAQAKYENYFSHRPLSFKQEFRAQQLVEVRRLADRIVLQDV